MVISKKIIIIGEGGTGKTTLLLRYSTGRFFEDTKMTIGSDFFVKNIKQVYGNCDVYLKLLLWDFAGESRFRFFLGDYAKGSDIVIFAFDITRKKTLYHMVDWINILDSALSYDKNTPIYLIGNKYDLLEPDMKVDYKYIKKWCSDYHVKKYYETSSRTGYNVEELFSDITQCLLESTKSTMY